MQKYVLTYQKNIRDLGGMKGYQGKTIKYNRIYRGGALRRLTDEDVKIIESFNLTDVVDFRSKDEYENLNDYVLDGVKYHSFPVLKEEHNETIGKKEDGNLLWFIEKGLSGYEHLLKMYKNLPLEENSINAYKNFFKILLEDDKIVYFHCSQGKDRAGFGAYLIEIALGVSEEDAIEDYLLTNEAMDIKVVELLEIVKDKPFYNEQYKQSLYDIFAAKKEYITATVDVINKEYGSTLNFIKNVLNVDIDKLRKLYLE